MEANPLCAASLLWHFFCWIQHDVYVQRACIDMLASLLLDLCNLA